MKTFSATPADIDKQWVVIDAEGVVLGRLASIIAMRLRGKHKPSFTPSMDNGRQCSFVINADKVAGDGPTSPNKPKLLATPVFPGGIKSRTTGQISSRGPIRAGSVQAVKRMLPGGPCCAAR